MDNKEIKKANRKALPKFLLIMLSGILVGVVLGLIVAVTGGIVSTEWLKTAASWFGKRLAPWLMVLGAAAEAAVCAPLYLKGKKLLSRWDGEDEAVSDKAEEKLSYVLWLSDCVYILSFFLIAATYSSTSFADFGDKRTMPFIVSVVGFIAILIETLVFQQKALDAAKKTNPEKTVSYYDPKFQKKWLDSCDEAEKLVIGRCAYKAFAATNKVCVLLAGLLAAAALVFEIGFTASLAVCVIWFVSQLVYFRETMKYSKAGNKIS